MKTSNILISILVILNILMGIKFNNNYQKQKKIAEAFNFCKSKLENSEEIVKYFEKSMEQQRETWNKPFFEVSNTIDMGNGAKLCLRVSFRNCSKCVERELKNLKTVKELIGLDKIVLLVDFQDSSQMNFFIEEYEIPYETVFCKHLNIGIEAYNNPYYFVANNKEIQYPFIPLKDKPELFKSYIQNLLPIFKGYSLQAF